MNRRSASVGLSGGLLLLLGGSAYADMPNPSSSMCLARQSIANASVSFTLPSGWMRYSSYTTFDGMSITTQPTGVNSSTFNPFLSTAPTPGHSTTASENFLITAKPPTMGGQLTDPVPFSISVDANIVDTNHMDKASATAKCDVKSASCAVPNTNAQDPTSQGDSASGSVKFYNNSGSWTMQGTVSVTAVCNP